MSEPVLVSKPLSHIVTFWRPGSYEWTWADEYADLINDDVTRRVDQRVRAEGIDFADSFAPVLLGSDGRVWDGHHRIVLAIKYAIPSLMCEIAKNAGDAALCGPVRPASTETDADEGAGARGPQIEETGRA